MKPVLQANLQCICRARQEASSIFIQKWESAAHFKGIKSKGNKLLVSTDNLVS